MTDNDKQKLDPEWLRVQLEALADWALDIATKVARGDEDDLEAIENVRSFVHDYFDGNRAEIPFRDLLTTITILITAIELDGELEPVSVSAPRDTFRDVPARLPAFIRCPGPVVRRRQLPGNTAPATRLAA